MPKAWWRFGQSKEAMPTTTEPMTTGLDTILYHLKRAKELLGELRSEQQGMPETHLLENLAILEAETESIAFRVDGLIAEVRK